MLIASKILIVNLQADSNDRHFFHLTGSNGVIHLWDFKSGHKFQKIHRTRVYESQEFPICVNCVAFDKSGSRLIACDASNVIKVYREAYTRVRIFIFFNISLKLLEAC